MKDLLIPGNGSIRDNHTWLSNMADETIENYVYQHQLDEDEINEQRELYASNAIQIALLEEEKAQVMREYNDRLKRMKGAGNLSLSLIRTGIRQVSGTAYVITDASERRVGIFDVNGRILSQRPVSGQGRNLFAGDRLPYVGDEQTEMTSQKTGTND